MPQPVQTVLRYTYNKGPLDTAFDQIYLDLWRDLNVVNRKFMPQGQMLAIQSIQGTIVSTTADNKISFATAPLSWPTQQSWKKLFEDWKMKRALVFEAGGYPKQKWADFKLYLEQQMVTQELLGPGSAKPSLVDAAGDVIEMGSWEYSDVFGADDGEFEDQAFAGLCGESDISGTNWIYVSALHEYQKSTAKPTVEPNVDPLYDDSFYVDSALPASDLFIAEMHTQDEPPYPKQNFQLETLQQQFVEGVDNRVFFLPGFVAPCGLVKINLPDGIVENTTITMDIQVNLAPAKSGNMFVSKKMEDL